MKFNQWHACYNDNTRAHKSDLVKENIEIPKFKPQSYKTCKLNEELNIKEGVNN